ncbi:Vga family ABC-F type ribosomal protection protein [Ornithinibacillus halotolerans]|uniref:ABC-F type ribosomal protection protein n=1 Tax=Ornithinibacillus halotolerans TaxID=1274357 RepID=A0A916RKG1_9BACI|nr:Vga family ABC-F type ribosomal protection protein [Ornithinibacillus halotolerans]GGA60673.1 ABC-F type ribosomal protection protein [Ornithinibacillus halotolerans]
MMLLQAQTIKEYIGDRLLLDINHLEIHQGDRIGLVGLNGSGKTTLLEILSGKRRPEEGKVNRYTTCDLIPQFKRIDSVKSGGEVTQEYIRDAVIEQAELMLADEPTTNLDADHIEWLENLLAEWQGAYVLVSHDRKFLDTLCTTIWELDEGKINVYSGNYSQYMEQKNLEDEQKKQAYEQYEKKKRQLEEALKKKEQKAERATKKPKQTSKSEAKITGAKPYFAKKQKKLQKTAKAIETRLEKLESVEKVKDLAPIKMDLPNEDTFKNRIVMRVEDLEGKIGKRILWHHVSFHVRGGDKLAIIGPNGSGKTTFVKMLMNQKKEIHLSPSVKLGYFSQNLSVLDSKQTILENVQNSSKQSETLIRTVLARMHFYRDDVYKQVDVLSGGERVKVALAKIFLSDINTLVLDEPTNFLDTEAVEALESLLKEYEGTVIFVSHDRRLIENVAKKILEIREQHMHFFDGTFDEYNQAQMKHTEEELDEDIFLVEMKISEVLSRLSLEPSESLEQEFQELLKKKRELTGS